MAPDHHDKGNSAERKHSQLSDWHFCKCPSISGQSLHLIDIHVLFVQWPFGCRTYLLCLKQVCITVEDYSKKSETLFSIFFYFLVILNSQYYSILSKRGLGKWDMTPKTKAIICITVLPNQAVLHTEVLTRSSQTLLYVNKLLEKKKHLQKHLKDMGENLKSGSGSHISKYIQLHIYSRVGFY